jgi:NADP-dependent 3-hydroxy acid dehydrogenase YdfG
MSAIELEGTAVAVTGGGRGIGRSTAEAFAAAGARVAIGDLDEDRAREAASDIGDAAIGLELDVSSRKSFASFLEAAESANGPTGVLVNNAGIMPLGPFLEEDDETTQRILDVNLRGVITGMKLVLPGMVARASGHVINVASLMGKLHVPGAAVYTASKHAVVGLGATVRSELRSTGVTITTVLPSAVKTELVAGVPLGRGLPTVEPKQVADAVVGSCRNRPGEVHVPGWTGLAERAIALAPHPLVDRVRRLIGDDRALTSIDAEERAAYEERIRGD